MELTKNFQNVCNSNVFRKGERGGSLEARGSANRWWKANEIIYIVIIVGVKIFVYLKVMCNFGNSLLIPPSRWRLLSLLMSLFSLRRPGKKQSKNIKLNHNIQWPQK